MTKTWATCVKVPGGYCQAITCGTFVKTIDRDIVYDTPEEATAIAARHLASAQQIRDRRHRHAGVFGACVMLAMPTVLVFATLALIDDIAIGTRLVSAGIAAGTLLVVGAVSMRRDIPEAVARYLDAAKVSKT